MSSRLADPKFLTDYIPLNNHLENIMTGEFPTEEGTIAYADGPHGRQGVNFTGPQSLSFTVPTHLQASTSFSVAFWAKFAAYQLNDVAVAITDGGSSSEGFLFYPYDSFQGNGVRLLYQGINVINENTAKRIGWNHFILVTRGDADHEVYANGESIGADATSLPMDGELDQFFVGAWKTGNQHFTGGMADVRIYNVGLTALEAKELFRRPVPRG